MEDVSIRDMGTIGYADAWEIQRGLFDDAMRAKTEGKPAVHTLLFCEHPHVYTLGKSGDRHNLLVSDEFLRSVDAVYYETDRGGDITYHGYGQVVGYPILDIGRFGIGLKDYVEGLEEAVIRTVASYGIQADRLAGATGVWLDADTPRARKICAIGVKASRFVTMHGFALNVNTDLKYFSYINPCGFVDKGVTSIEKETGRKQDMEEVKRRFAACFEEVFKCKIIIKTLCLQKKDG